jgi:predicted nucleotide-binding protein (sugar kinase/HSP70/actin superfamily)
MSPKPCLLLELDEHSADAGVITRLEAFLESLKHYQPAVSKEKTQRLESSRSVGKERTLYIPYMGDCSYAVAACFRGYGQPAEVMPMADEASLIRGRQFTSGKECLPCAITAGDMLTVISSEDFDPEKAAFFMPGGKGPCRFGMYNCLHKLILRYAGQADVRIIAPNQDGDFYHDFAQSIGSSIKGSFMKDIWIATVGVDLMYKVLLKKRPFAKDAKQAQSVYEQCLRSWVRAVEKRVGLPELAKICGTFAEEFSSIEFDYTIRKPMIGIVGEIYVRSHPFANKDIIARLEDLGAVCDLACLAEWIYYTNFTRKNRAMINVSPKILLSNLIQNKLQHKIEKTLAEPFMERFGQLAEEPIEHVISLAGPYLHNSFEGEAILSVGKMVEYHHKGFGGVINLMPFSCMPSTIVSTQTRRISAECGDMPILNLSFDGQEDPILETKLEAFVEQIRQKQKGVLNAEAACFSI